MCMKFTFYEVVNISPNSNIYLPASTWQHIEFTRLRPQVHWSHHELCVWTSAIRLTTNSKMSATSCSTLQTFLWSPGREREKVRVRKSESEAKRQREERNSECREIIRGSYKSIGNRALPTQLVMHQPLWDPGDAQTHTHTPAHSHTEGERHTQKVRGSESERVSS